MDLSEFCVVQTTIDDQSRADAIASALVEQKFAACVQIIQVASHYIWKGVAVREQEFLLIAKTRRADFAALAEAIRAMHTYELPEIVALPLIAGDPGYLGWIESQTTRG